ncbi:MAG: signal recognition particle protein [Chloroflexia bacterium]|nr:signal recognition particle protein [Chloroflexia bacterium]
MFETLTDRLQTIFRHLGARGKLSEKDVEAALREVRLALLEADVHYKVVKDFLGRVREQAIGEQVMRSLTPAQQVIKIVHQELIHTLGKEAVPLKEASPPPTILMLVGLQGSGKTTMAAKLGLHLRSKGAFPLLVAADLRRPAAIRQLEILGEQLDLPVYSDPQSKEAPRVARQALKQALQQRRSHLILDTAGRLHVDEELMQELVQVQKAVSPQEILLVADAMTGQDAVRVASEFHQRLDLSGLILTKVDGDARGGAALSIRSVTGVPIKFLGVGEKTDALEVFYPERLASRILGMGDVLSLIERAETSYTEEQARQLEQKVRKGTFDLEDFLEQLNQLRQMGPLDQLLDMIPGLGSMMRSQKLTVDEKQFRRLEAIILSMTPEERRRPQIIGGSRKRRIARGSGTSLQDVNALLNRFQQYRKMMRKLTKGQAHDILSLLR